MIGAIRADTQQTGARRCKEMKVLSLLVKAPQIQLGASKGLCQIHPPATSISKMLGSHARRNLPSINQKPCNPSKFSQHSSHRTQDWGIRRSSYHCINLSCIIHIISYISSRISRISLIRKNQAQNSLDTIQHPISVGKPLAKSNSCWQNQYLSNSKDQSSNH